jgi:hypothetical protein
MSLAPFIESYKANLDEATVKLRAAAARVENLRAAELIYRDDEGITRCKGVEAGRAYGDFVRWNSDWEHWRDRVRQAHRDAGQEAVAEIRKPGAPPPVQTDMRLPPERDDDSPI